MAGMFNGRDNISDNHVMSLGASPVLMNDAFTPFLEVEMRSA